MNAAWKMAEGAAVCVSPYYPTAILQSTSPTKLVEYMALCTPVVANSHPEQSDIVARSGCGIVCGWGEEEFADAIVTVLSSPTRAAAMGAAGRRFVETERTHSVMVDLVLERYRNVLRRPPAPVRFAWLRGLREPRPRARQVGKRAGR
jgi:glycosyltransferase involved in cell wall biosynthesis